VFSDGELTLEELERRYLQFILRRTKGNQSSAARILGINRKTLGQKIQKYNLRTSF
jgi:two-component system response regulator AtoC